MKHDKELLKKITVCFIAFTIPCILVLNGIQSRRFASVENDIKMLEQRQKTLIEENKNLITGISVLSSTDRIEQLASEKLDMHLAETDEIIRVEMKLDGGSER